MDIVDVALKEVGYKAYGRFKTKYGEWYPSNGVRWCHIFVSWCASKAGVSEKVMIKTASTDAGIKWFREKNLFQPKGSYVPKRGDIVYFKTGASHVGIVEEVKNGELHTIEGNSGDAVKKKTYSLSHKTITGYGTPKYNNISSGGSSVNPEGELELLKRILKKNKPPQKINMNTKVVESRSKVTVNVVIDNGKQRFEIPILDGAEIVFDRVGTPGTLKFSILPKKEYKVEEGNEVLFSVDKKKIFLGYIFTMDYGNDGEISVTAYNQIRYLKNKDLVICKNESASDLLKRLAKKHELKCGEIEETGHKMNKIEENITLIDIIQNALDETLVYKNKIFVLYDDVGKLTLKNVNKLKVDSCLIDEESAEGYSYTSSIDKDTYNTIQLTYKSGNDYNHYVEKDSNNIKKWGLLQYAEIIDVEAIGKLKAQALLKYYNQKTKNLSITNAVGNTNVIGGSTIPICLTLNDTKVQNYLLVEKVTHKFESGHHTMNLVLNGGGFVV